MFYYIDGYNLIFSLTDTKKPLIHQRKTIVHFLQKRFVKLHLTGLVVFDGSHRRSEESGLSYASPLEIAYTPKGQTADEYILEKLEWNQQQIPSTVISNDRSLCSQARQLGAKTQSNDAFIHYLEKKKARKREKSCEAKDSPRQIERLLKIFESKLGED